VIYMPGNRYAELAAELQAAGIGSEIPCMVISHATTSEESIFHTTVAQLPQCPKAASPSLIIVGVVAAAAKDSESRDQGISRELNDEVLQLALQHPYFGGHGRSGVE